MGAREETSGHRDPARDLCRPDVDVRDGAEGADVTGRYVDSAVDIRCRVRWSASAIRRRVNVKLAAREDDDTAIDGATRQLKTKRSDRNGLRAVTGTAASRDQPCIRNIDGA